MLVNEWKSNNEEQEFQCNNKNLHHNTKEALEKYERNKVQKEHMMAIIKQRGTLFEKP